MRQGQRASRRIRSGLDMRPSTQTRTGQRGNIERDRADFIDGGGERWQRGRRPYGGLKRPAKLGILIAAEPLDASDITLITQRDSHPAVKLVPSAIRRSRPRSMHTRGQL